MQPGQVRCSRCGWQNETGDRMCGGCGQPLLQAGNTFGAPPDRTPTVASQGAGAPPPLSQDTRTATWTPPAYPPRYTQGTPTVAATTRGVPVYAQAAQAQPRATAGGCIRRTLVGFIIAVLLLMLLLACGWAAIVRPALHTAVDQSLRTGLSQTVDKVPVIPEGIPPITRTITESQFNYVASGGNAQNDRGDMKDIRVHFLPGEVTMTFRLWGRAGKISVHVVARGGRLFVQNTHVDGWLGIIESGSELQDTLNESLAQLPAQDYVQRVIVDQGTLTLTIRHA